MILYFLNYNYENYQEIERYFNKIAKKNLMPLRWMKKIKWYASNKEY